MKKGTCSKLNNFTKECDPSDLINSNQTVPMPIACIDPAPVHTSSFLSMG